LPKPKKGLKREFESQRCVIAKKGTLLNASPRNPARPPLGKEAIALFFWLVLRTAPYSLIINILKLNIHVIKLLQAFCLELFSSQFSVPSRKLTGSGLKTGFISATTYSRFAG